MASSSTIASADGQPGFPISCACGHIRFRTPPLAQPLGMYYCHCTDCRKQSGSAFGTSIHFSTDKIFPLPDDVETKLAVFTHPTDSGNTKRAYFCPRCGSRIFNTVILKDGSLRPAVSFKAGVVDDSA